MEMKSITEDLEIPLPVLDGVKNFHRWSVMMGLLFNFHEVQEIVNEGVSEMEESASNEKDRLALTLIHQCVNSDILEKIGASKNANEAWNTLHQIHQGTAKKSNREKRVSVSQKTETAVKENEGRTLGDQPQQQLEDRNLPQPHAESRPEDGKSPQLQVNSRWGSSRVSDEPRRNGAFGSRDLNPDPEDRVIVKNKGAILTTKEDQSTQEVFSEEKKVDRRVSRRLNHKQNLNLHQSNPMIVNRTILIRKKNLKKKIVRGERVRGTVTVAEGDSPEVVFTESQRQCPKRVSATSSSVRAVRTSAVSSLASLGRATPWRVCVREKKKMAREKSVRVVPLSKLGEISEIRVWWNLSFAEVCVMCEKKSARERLAKLMRGAGLVSVREDSVRAMATSCGKATKRVKKKMLHAASKRKRKMEEARIRSNREEKRRCEIRSIPFWKNVDQVGHVLNLMGLSPVQAQFEFKSGSGSKAKNNSMVEAQCLQQSEWFISEYVDLPKLVIKMIWSLILKPWDPGIIFFFVIPNYK